MSTAAVPVWGRGLLPPAAGDTVTVGQILKRTHSAAAQVTSCQTHLGEEAAQMMKINDSLPVWLLTLTLMRGRLIHSSPPHLANRATDFLPITSLILRSFLCEVQIMKKGLRAHHHHHHRRYNNTALPSSE